jgi:hypothetical protein
MCIILLASSCITASYAANDDNNITNGNVCYKVVVVVVFIGSTIKVILIENLPT